MTEYWRHDLKLHHPRSPYMVAMIQHLWGTLVIHKAHATRLSFSAHLETVAWQSVQGAPRQNHSGYTVRG